MANQGNKFPVPAPPGLDFFALCCDFLMNLVGVVLHFEQAIKGWLQFLFNWQRNLWSAARLKYSNNNQSRNHQDQEWRHNLLLAITPEKGVTLFAGKQKSKWWAICFFWFAMRSSHETLYLISTQGVTESRGALSLDLYSVDTICSDILSILKNPIGQNQEIIQSHLDFTIFLDLSCFQVVTEWVNINSSNLLKNSSRASRICRWVFANYFKT